MASLGQDRHLGLHMGHCTCILEFSFNSFQLLPADNLEYLEIADEMAREPSLRFLLVNSLRLVDFYSENHQLLI